MPYREWTDLDPETRELVRYIAERPPEVIKLDPKPRYLVRYYPVLPQFSIYDVLAVDDVPPLVSYEHRAEYAHEAYMSQFITTSEGQDEEGPWRRGFTRIVTCWGWFPDSKPPEHIPDEMLARLKAALAEADRAYQAANNPK